MEWNLRTCARKGHVTYAADEPEYREKLEADTPLGDAWRCLRCGTYVLGEPHGTGPAEDAPVLLRGKALRARSSCARSRSNGGSAALLLIVLGVAVFRLKSTQVSLQGTVRSRPEVARPVLPADPLQRVRLLDDPLDREGAEREAVDAEPGRLRRSCSTACCRSLEGIGLWSLKRWGEYVAVVGTTLFIPLEVYELTEKVSWLKIAVLLVNVAAVLYLLLSKRLFGIRGGHARVRGVTARGVVARGRGVVSAGVSRSRTPATGSSAPQA